MILGPAADRHGLRRGIPFKRIRGAHLQQMLLMQHHKKQQKELSMTEAGIKDRNNKGLASAAAARCSSRYNTKAYGSLMHGMAAAKKEPLVRGDRIGR